MVPKAHQEDPVLRPQHIPQKGFEIARVLLHKVILAAADIDDQSQRKRYTLRLREVRDLLRGTVFEHLHLVVRHSIHQRSRRVAHRKRDADEVYLYPQRILRRAMQAQQPRQQHRQHP